MKVESKGISLIDTILNCNQYFDYVTNYASFFHDARFKALLNLAIHNTINSIQPEYETYLSQSYDYIDTSKYSLQASVLGVCYIVRKYVIENDIHSNSDILWYTVAQQAMLLNDSETFINETLNLIVDKQKHIDDGYNFGIMVGNDTIQNRSLDGWNGIVTPQLGVYPYVPGQWYTALTTDGFTYPIGLNTTDSSISGAIFPQYVFASTWALPSSSYIYVEPRPDFNSTNFTQSYQETYNRGFKYNSYKMRLITEEYDALTIGGAPAHAWALLLVKNIVNNNKPLLNGHDVAYLFAQTYIAGFDSYIHNVYWKHVYNYDRPIQLFHNGGGISYPTFVPDINWRFLLNGANNPEYPAGHPESSSTFAEALRLSLITIGLVNSSNIFNNDTIPGGPISMCYSEPASFTPVQLAPCNHPVVVSTFSEFKDRVIRARISGGMHYTISGVVARRVGEEISAYIVSNIMLPLS